MTPDSTWNAAVIDDHVSPKIILMILNMNISTNDNTIKPSRDAQRLIPRISVSVLADGLTGSAETGLAKGAALRTSCSDFNGALIGSVEAGFTGGDALCTGDAGRVRLLLNIC
jgi:hypothetical protein